MVPQVPVTPEDDITAAARSPDPEAGMVRVRVPQLPKLFQQQHEDVSERKEERGAAARGILSAGPPALSRCRDLGVFEALLDHWSFLGEQPDDAWWQALERESAGQLSGAAPHSIATLLAAMARVGRRPSAAWLAIAQSELTASSERGAGPSVATWATALTALVKAGAVERRCEQALLADTAKKLPSAPPAAVGQLLAGVARSRCHPSDAWLSSMVDTLTSRACELTASQLAGGLKSLALLGERVEEERLMGAAAVLARHVMWRPEGAAPGELAQALWALARLGYGAKSGAVYPVSALLPIILEQLPRLSPTQLSSLLWALAKLGARLAPSPCHLLADELTAQMQAMSNKEFTSSIWALAKLAVPGRQPTAPPPSDHIHNVANANLDDWASLNAGTDATAARAAPAVARGAGRTRAMLFVPHEAFVDRLWQQAHLRSQRLAPGESTRLLWAVGRLGLEAPPHWLRGALAAAQRTMPSYRPDQLADTVVALARMGRAPPVAWLQAFEEVTEERLRGFNLQELVNVLWALNTLGRSPSRPWQDACLDALCIACAEACGQAGGSMAPDAVGAMLSDAGLLPVLEDAVAARPPRAASAAAGPGQECRLDFAFELPLGAT